MPVTPESIWGYQRLAIKMMALPTFGHQDDGVTNVWPQKMLELDILCLARID